MAVTSLTLETEVEALVVSIGAEDFDSARKSVVKIRALLIALPDYGRSAIFRCLENENKSLVKNNQSSVKPI